GRHSRAGAGHPPAGAAGAAAAGGGGVGRRDDGTAGRRERLLPGGDVTWRLRAVMLGLLVAAAGCRSGSGGAPVDDATARELGELKNAIVEGHRTRDRAALDQLYAEDYVATDPRGGTRTKA